ncbi:MAG: patatin-like phospholipase family protein [Anaerolineae bacterium]
MTFVLGGGGARGALQLGALRALFEAGIQPDLLVGTSIGAANATGLALWGVNQTGIEALERSYQKMADSNLLNPRFAQLIRRLLSGHPSHYGSRRVAEFFIAQGITPDLCFGQITGVRLAMVAADLVSGDPVIYGQNPEQSILEALLASVALPPWFAPVEHDGHFIVDGGALSNLPIEPAMRMGAMEIIALDVDDPGTVAEHPQGLNQVVAKLIFTVSQRYIQLETALAEARGVPVHRIELRCPETTQLWDFQNYRQLIQAGYETATREMPGWARGS